MRKSFLERFRNGELRLLKFTKIGTDQPWKQSELSSMLACMGCAKVECTSFYVHAHTQSKNHTV